MGWTPKAFRPQPQPTDSQLISFCDAVDKHCSGSTATVFILLALQEPGQRLEKAAGDTVKACMSSVVTNTIKQALPYQEYQAYVEVASSTKVPPALRGVADQLLCIQEREHIAQFFRLASKAYNSGGKP